LRPTQDKIGKAGMSAEAVMEKMDRPTLLEPGLS